MKRLVAIAPIAALAVAGCGSSSNQAAPPSVKQTSGVEKVPVRLDEFKIQPAVTRLKPGKVEFLVKNTGKTDHEFVVIDTRKPAADLLHGKRASEKGSLGETGDLKPGQSKRLVLKLPKGHYAVICNDPGHYMAGMHKDLYVV